MSNNYKHGFMDMCKQAGLQDYEAEQLYKQAFLGAAIRLGGRLAKGVGSVAKGTAAAGEKALKWIGKSRLVNKTIPGIQRSVFNNFAPFKKTFKRIGTFTRRHPFLGTVGLMAAGAGLSNAAKGLGDIEDKRRAAMYTLTPAQERIFNATRNDTNYLGMI